jgi:poly(3-hydroxybutyrate) depolymerase
MPSLNMVIINLTNFTFLASALLSTTNAAVSSGCGKDLPEAQKPAGGASHQTNFAQSDGTDRTYLIHIPSNYNINTPVPLIFSFHGGGKTSAEQEELSQFSNEYFNPNGIAVYPQGIDVSFSLDFSTNLRDI